MKKTILLLIAVGVLSTSGQAIPTDKISAVRQNLLSSGANLSDADRAAIDEFWRIGLDAILLAEQSEQMVSIRRQIQQEKGQESLSFYATGYLQAGRQYLGTAFATVSDWQPSEKKTLVERNLMILVAQLQSPLLAEFGLKRLAEKDEVVRYWAVKAVAGPALAMQLTDPSTGDAQMTETILKALAERVPQESSIEILRTIVQFASMVNQDTARQILISAAEQRIESYKSWKVDNEQFDAVLLKSMGQILLGEQQFESRAMMARRFSELMSLIFQRYMLTPSPLTESQKSALVNVIAEVDSQILGRLMNQQTPFLRLIQRGGQGLDREYEAYFGSEVGPGSLATRLKFDYGKTSAGKAITAPPKLSSPPQP